MMRKSIRKVAMGIPVLALALAACGPADGGPLSDDDSDSSESSESDSASEELTGDPIVIGVQQDDSGPSAPFATLAGMAIKEAVEELNQGDGILGRPVEVITENDESDPTKAPSVSRKLIDQGAHALLMTSSVSAIAQTKPVFEEEGIPAVSAIASVSTFADPPDNSFTYSVPNTTSEWVPVYCGAFEEDNYKKIAVLADDSSVIKSMTDGMLPEMEGCVEIVEDIRAPLDAQDVNPQVARVVDSDPDAVFVASVGGQFEVLVHNTLATVAPDLPRFSMAGLGNEPDAWELADPGALEDLVFIGSISTENERTVALQDKIREWRGEPDYIISGFDAQAYDSVHLLKAAIEAADSTDGEAINEALQELQGFNSTFGQEDLTLSFGSGEDEHIAADGLCGLVLTVFGEDNKPAGPWGDYQPSCS